MSERTPWRAVIGGNVLALGVVSLLTDVSSEMIYPLLPVFLSQLTTPGAAAIALGAMDGLADLVAAWLKLWAGRASDRSQRRKPLALAGYAVSAVARPLVAFALAPWHVVLVRALDRVGKGVRGAPRDALIAESVPAAHRGVAFSFHRLMDHTGAFVGPLAAAAILLAALGEAHAWSGTAPSLDALRMVFLAAALPGALGVIALALFVRERALGPGAATGPDVPVAPQQSQAALSPAFRRTLGAFVVFALGNSTDIFLVFDAQARLDLGPLGVLALWVWLHAAKIAFSLPGGRLADRVSRRTAILAGWAVYAGCYAALAFAPGVAGTLAVLAAYGAYYGLVEGAEKALLADLVAAPARGRAFGLLHAATGLAALPASLLFGALWATAGREVAFLTGASLAALAAVVLVAPRALPPR